MLLPDKGAALALREMRRLRRLKVYNTTIYQCFHSDNKGRAGVVQKYHVIVPSLSDISVGARPLFELESDTRAKWPLARKVLLQIGFCTSIGRHTLAPTAPPAQMPQSASSGTAFVTVKITRFLFFLAVASAKIFRFSSPPSRTHRPCQSFDTRDFFSEVFHPVH